MRWGGKKENKTRGEEVVEKKRTKQQQHTHTRCACVNIRDSIFIRKIKSCKTHHTQRILKRWTYIRTNICCFTTYQRTNWFEQAQQLIHIQFKTHKSPFGFFCPPVVSYELNSLDERSSQKVHEFTVKTHFFFFAQKLLLFSFFSLFFSDKSRRETISNLQWNYFPKCVLCIFL